MISKRKQIKVLKAAKKTLMESHGVKLALCTLIRRALQSTLSINIVLNREIVDYIPLFTFENAVKYANAGFFGDYWWDTVPFDMGNRLKFLDWMIDETRDKIWYWKIINRLKSVCMLSNKKKMGLTNKEQIKILKSVREDICETFGLCSLTHCKIRKWLNFSGKVCTDSYIPLFTRENAVKYANASTSGAYWWSNSPYDFKNRVKFLDWVIKETRKRIWYWKIIYRLKFWKV
jgi:hypothetical protein